MNIAFVIFGYGILFLIDGYPLLKGYKPGKFLPYMIVFSFAFLVSALMAMEVKLPSPAEGIKRIIMIIIGE